MIHEASRDQERETNQLHPTVRCELCSVVLGTSVEEAEFNAPDNSSPQRIIDGAVDSRQLPSDGHAKKIKK
eukprot:CAMPEP_0180488800 /NCGR_PEP_ID=MMETSP1036_2-20121128/38251_1 /TAXON_ID=632150 /ORGANISM="Azadinium spinosum, Strain 3D9" /LENGTH=70 /DNA_ID=CAMNT_0022496903 /DNA_START=141 /DNA_END=353 /DNA_ORIENTATION=+